MNSRNPLSVLYHSLTITVFFIVLLCFFYRTSSGAIESSSSSSSDYDNDFDNYQRRSMLPSPRGRSQSESRISPSSPYQSPPTTTSRNRRDKSKDLKKLIQELEESDYSNYGSWGNFQQKQPVSKSPDQRLEASESQNSEQNVGGGMIYHVDREREHDLDYDDDYFEIQEHEDFEDDGNFYYPERVPNQESIERTNESDQYRGYNDGNPPSQKRIENTPFQDGMQYEEVDYITDNSALVLDLYSPDEEQRKRELYDSWVRYQSSQTLQPAVSTTDLALTQLDSAHEFHFSSVVRISLIAVLSTFLSYVSVSPRSLPLVEYNKAYKETLFRVLCSYAWPALLISQLSAPTVTVNDVISKFTQSFSLGYLSIYAIELMAATGVRLVILRFMEPDAFRIRPKIPSIFLPWKFSEHNYRAKLSTLTAMSILDTCVLSPVVEEYGKLLLLRMFVRKQTKVEKEKVKAKKVQENVPANVGNVLLANSDTAERPVRQYVVIMTAVSLGMKVADNLRRVLLYARTDQTHKLFFAMARSFFPVRELCGVMTALAFARKEILGYKTSTWRMLLPSVSLHAIAAVRGLKPFYVWNSNRPWDELQLDSWSSSDEGSPTDMLGKAALNLLWFGMLARTVSTLFGQYVQLSREYLLKLKSKELMELEELRAHAGAALDYEGIDKNKNVPMGTGPTHSDNNFDFNFNSKRGSTHAKDVIDQIEREREGRGGERGRGREGDAVPRSREGSGDGQRRNQQTPPQQKSTDTSRRSQEQQQGQQQGQQGHGQGQLNRRGTGRRRSTEDDVPLDRSPPLPSSSSDLYARRQSSGSGRNPSNPNTHPSPNSKNGLYYGNSNGSSKGGGGRGGGEGRGGGGGGGGRRFEGGDGNRRK